jgi:pimeloyl-ACP methyl ester carboxylesterase
VHPEAQVDIILVHGLNGHPKKTWRAKGDADDVFWPIDLLPAALQGHHANVLVYGYNADVYAMDGNKHPTSDFIHSHAQTLVTTLTQYRKRLGTLKNAIVWVAHSLGGILTKRALLYSNDLSSLEQQDYRSIFVSTYAIIFLGTPHSGSDVSKWAVMLQGMSDVVVPKKLFQAESVLLKTLKKNSEVLQEINSRFLDICRRFQMHMAHETHKSDIKGAKVFIVDAASASAQIPGVTAYGIEADHKGICKFNNANSPGFSTMTTAIRDWVFDAPIVVEDRWTVEEEQSLARVQQDNEERMRQFVCLPCR